MTQIRERQRISVEEVDNELLDNLFDTDLTERELEHIRDEAIDANRKEEEGN